MTDYAELVKHYRLWPDELSQATANAIQALVKERNQIAMELAVNGNSADRAWRAGREAGIREAANMARGALHGEKAYRDILALLNKVDN